MKRNFKENFLLEPLLANASQAPATIQTAALDTISVDEIGLLLDLTTHGATSVLTLQLQSSVDSAFTVPINEGSAVVLDQAVEDDSGKLVAFNVDASLLQARYTRLEIVIATAASTFGVHAIGLTNREMPVPISANAKGIDLLSNETV